MGYKVCRVVERASVKGGAAGRFTAGAGRLLDERKG
jgi:hypothetical protein